MNCHLLLQHGPCDDLVVILPYAIWWNHWRPRYTQILQGQHLKWPVFAMCNKQQLWVQFEFRMTR